MRRRVLFGLGLGAGLVGVSGAFAQFAVDRAPPPAAPSPVLRPSLPSVPAPAPAALPSFPTGPAAAIPTPRNPVMQASYSAPAAQTAPVVIQPAAQTHPMAVKPEHGPWMIIVKSYSGTGAKELAESMTAEIRQTYKTPAFLFEWGAEERQREEARLKEVRDRYRKEYEPFLKLQDEIKAKAAQQGTEFVDEPVRIPIPKIEVRTQWGVLIGGFKDMDAARAALDTVRKWPAPTNTALLDQTMVSRPGAGGKREKADTHLNPFQQSFVVPNPALRRAERDAAVIHDPALLKLNEEEPYSLLKARKPWTLMVKRYAVPSRVVGADESTNVIARLFTADKSAQMLEDVAKQARNLAETLRNPQQPQQFEAFVLHDRTESVVAVGQFDGPDDPTIVPVYLALSKLTYDVYDKDPKKDPTARKIESRRVFDAITPMRVPKVQ